jgi:Rrf2 family protein
MLSLTCKTAIKAVIFLCSRADPGEKPGIREIAAAIDANEHTVGKFLQTLVKQKVINSMKGPSGGFYVSREQQQLPIMAIIEAIDGDGFFKGCGLGLPNCSEKRPCPIHHEYKEGRVLLERLFRSRRIADLCKTVNKGTTYLTG